MTEKTTRTYNEYEIDCPTLLGSPMIIEGWKDANETFQTCKNHNHGATIRMRNVIETIQVTNWEDANESFS